MSPNILQLGHTKIVNKCIWALLPPEISNSQWFVHFFLNSSQNKRRSLMRFFLSPSSTASVKSHSHASSYFSMHQLEFESVPEKESPCISRFSILPLVASQILHSMFQLGLWPRYIKTSQCPVSQGSSQGKDPPD